MQHCVGFTIWEIEEMQDRVGFTIWEIKEMQHVLAFRKLQLVVFASIATPM